MAGRLFNAVGKIGIGLAVAGGVVQSALYNGKKLISFGKIYEDTLIGRSTGGIEL